jgi:hypothetical protein
MIPCNEPGLGDRLQGVRYEKSAVVLGVVAATLLAGCASEPVARDPAAAPGTSSAIEVRPAAPAPDGERPPRLVVYGDGGPVSVDPTSSCWSGTCADGAYLPATWPHVSGVSLPIGVAADTSLFVEMRSLDRRCTTSESAHLTTDHEGHATLEPLGPPGRYEVSVSVQRPGGGDASYELVWNSPAEGSPPPARAEMGFLAAHADGGRVMAFGLSVETWGIRGADLTGMTAAVTAADGSTVTLPTPPRTAGRDRTGCPPASVTYEGAATDLAPVPGLGPGPYTYRVTLTIAGRQYVGTGVWPRDEDPYDQPYVPLAFVPPLPRWPAWADRRAG